MGFKRKNSSLLLGVLMMLLCGVTTLSAQEINATVTVNYTQIQGTNVSVFKTLEVALNEFINNTVWTDQEYESNERIQCNFTLNLSSALNNEYEGSLAITARRPIYNASINTTLLNLMDKDIKFTYKEFDPLVFNRNSLTQDLTAVVGYYVYLILAIDGDTFKQYGGDSYYNAAMELVNNAQSSGALNKAGWDRLKSEKNRSLLVTELMSAEYKPYRSYLYRYHRLGLDVMSDDVKKGSAFILDGLKDLEKISVNSPSSYALQLFFDVKNVELQNIIREMNDEDTSEAQRKKEIIALLKRMDPSRIQIYESLLR